MNTHSRITRGSPESESLIYLFMYYFGVRVMLFNASFNNISVILWWLVIPWWSVLLVEEIRVPGENH